MRQHIITTILILAACGPVASADELDIKNPTHELADDPAGSTSFGATSTESSGSEGGDSGSTEPGSGGGTGCSDDASESGTGEDSSTGEELPGACTLPAAGLTVCQAIVEACDAIHCSLVGGSAWEVTAAQYFLGDADIARDTAECEADCGAYDDACAVYTTPATVCSMSDATDCIANAAAAGIVVDDSVLVTCGRLEVMF